MTSLRVRIIGFAGLMALCLAFVAAGPKYTTVEIFVAAHDGSFVEQATITVDAYANGANLGQQVADVEGPNAHARFSLPASTTSLTVSVNAAGYFYTPETYQLSRSHYVGGWGIWVHLDRCTDAASPSSR